MNIVDAYVIIPVKKEDDYLHNHHRIQFRKEKHQFSEIKIQQWT